MEVIFIAQKSGLMVNFRNLTLIPSGFTCKWDFGDDIQSDLTNPQHTYQAAGFYNVTLEVYDLDKSCVGRLSQCVVLSTVASTTLTGSIFYLIDVYVPVGLIPQLSFDKKLLYINKWQLFIQPLVNHEVPLEEYNDELYYEALENQLIMEAAAVDYITTELTNVIQSNSITATSSSEVSKGDSNEGVKKITTGPSEVEFFNEYDSKKDTVSNAIKALQPGGLLDTLKKNVCSLASRLDINLPFCRSHNHLIVPSVGDRRVNRGLKGPNPADLLNN